MQSLSILWPSRFLPVLLLLLWVLPSVSKESLPRTAIDTALSYEGIRETKNNSSPVIDKIIRYGGGKPGWYWCMYFVHYSYGKAAEALGTKNPLLRNGSCSRQLAYATRIGSPFRIIPIAGVIGEINLPAGAILIWKHGPSSALDIGRRFNGHTGIVIEQLTKNTVLTIEGNTSSQETRNGDGAWKNTRTIKKSGTFRIIAAMVFIEEITNDQLLITNEGKGILDWLFNFDFLGGHRG